MQSAEHVRTQSSSGRYNIYFRWNSGVSNPLDHNFTMPILEKLVASNLLEEKKIARIKAILNSTDLH